MREALKAAMTTSISEVLETMFFMTIETAESADLADVMDSAAGNCVASRINFKGPFSGYFLFMVPESILSAMTEMFMGLDAEEVTGSHLSGTISEAINMIAGNTFSKLDDQAVFKLDIPQLVDVSTLSGDTLQPGQERMSFRIETPGGLLGLQLLYAV